MSLRARVINTIGGVTLIAALILLLTAIILPTWSTTGGSQEVTLGLWSFCRVSSGAADCRSWDSCYLVAEFSVSTCIKLYFARIFLMISLVCSIVGFVCLLVFLILYCKKSDKGAGGAAGATFGCLHLLSFIAGIIGFPLGMSFALALPSSSVGLAAFLAMIAVIMNLISVIMLCTGLLRSDDKSVTPVENHNEEIPIGSDQLPIVPLRNITLLQTVSMSFNVK